MIRRSAHETARVRAEREPSEEAASCPECGSATVTTDEVRGERVCDECGAVLDDRVFDHGPEWRAFSHEQHLSRARTGAPTTLATHDRGLTTAIDWRNKDASGAVLSAEKRRTLDRLRTWQERIRTEDASERNLQFALGEVDRMGSSLGVPRSVREMAAVIYRRALDQDLIRGRSIEGVAAAALYAACRGNGTPRSLEEMAVAARVDGQEIGRTFRYVAQELSLELQPVDPTAYVPRFCSALDHEERTKQTALELVSAATDRGLHSGKSPTGFAAAAVYLAGRLCGDKRTQQDVAEVARVTEVTVRNRYQELEALLEEPSVTVEVGTAAGAD